jgi:hypothetical protein
MLAVNETLLLFTRGSICASFNGESTMTFNPLIDASTLAVRNVTILIPFDLGTSYVFKPKDDDLAEKQWAALFAGETPEGKWDTTQPGKQYRAPLGRRACWTPAPNPGDANFEKLQTRLNAFGCTMATAGATRASFYPNGLSLLVTRAKFLGDINSPRAYRAEREPLKAAFQPFVKAAAHEYATVMDGEAEKSNGEKIVHSWTALTRTRSIRKSGYPYLLWFIEHSTAEWKKEAERIQARSTSYGEVQVHIGWGEAIVFGATEGQRRSIVENFSIAFTCWFGMVVMDRLARYHIRDSMFSIASPEPYRVSLKSREIKLGYLEAMNAVAPFQWTTLPRDLDFLEQIHRVWHSSRWRRTVHDRTAMLSAHHSDLETEEEGKRNQQLTLFGYVIASVAIISAFVDLMSVSNKPLKMVIAVGGTALITFVAWQYLHWKKPAKTTQT